MKPELETKLWEQAWQLAVVESKKFNNDTPSFSDVITQFANLIVKECATVGNSAENNENELRCMYDVITSHFGVE
jgi:flagellar hook-associated protein FlgK